MTGNVIMRSPHQAANIYSGDGRFPKQKHVFLVRFHGESLQAPGLQFVVKTVDRPGVQPHTEELNQYNKKRQVYTGYKMQPIKMAFYDDANGAALRMFKDYSSYYFGDFGQVAGSWNYDATNADFLDLKKLGFGMKMPTKDTSFFFTSIDIIHIHNKTYDTFTLINPRITAFDPDDLDYENGAVSTISAQFAYEAVLVTMDGAASSELGEFNADPGTQFSDAVNEPEAALPSTIPTVPRFSSPSDAAATARARAGFNVNGTANGDAINTALAQTGYNVNGTANGNGAATRGAQVLSSRFTQGQYDNKAAVFRFTSPTPSGSLGEFGKFRFGPGDKSGYDPAAAATTNPTVGRLLDSLGAPKDPLSSAGSLPVRAASMALSGVPGAVDAVVSQQIAGSMAPGSTGTAQQLLTSASLVNALSAGVSSRTGAGLTLPLQVLATINAQRPGSAQYGYNPQITPAGQDYGYNGPSGFGGPFDGAGITLPTQEPGPFDGAGGTLPP